MLSSSPSNFDINLFCTINDKTSFEFQFMIQARTATTPNPPTAQRPRGNPIIYYNYALYRYVSFSIYSNLKGTSLERGLVTHNTVLMVDVPYLYILYFVPVVLLKFSESCNRESFIILTKLTTQETKQLCSALAPSIQYTSLLYIKCHRIDIEIMEHHNIINRVVPDYPWRVGHVL